MGQHNVGGSVHGLPLLRAPGSHHHRSPMTLPALRLGRILPLAAVLALTACDSTSGGSVDSEVTYKGRVTSDAAAARAVGVEGATVTSASVSSSGSVSALGGSATTDVEGTYTLMTAGTAQAAVVSAEKGAFETSALIEAGGAASGTIVAPPMTTETDAEAAVYVAARARGSRARVADAAYFVTADVASEIKAGRTTAAEVAAALDASLKAEGRQADADDEDTDELDDERDESYRALRLALYADASVSVSTEAFDAAYADAYSRASFEASAAARAARAGHP